MVKQKLIHGECLAEMAKLKDNSIDLILTDPPFGTTQNSWDVVIPFDKMWEQLNRIIKDNGVIVLFGSEPFSSLLRISNLKNFKYDWVWIKDQGTGHLNSKIQPMRNSENISVFYNNPCRYIPQKSQNNKPTNKSRNKTLISKKNLYGKFNDIGGRGGNTDRYPLTTLFFNKVNGNDKSNKFSHSTQKPVKLLEYLIKTYSLENETVLDFTMGSGTTLVACQNTGRNGIGIELDDNYFEIAEKRVAEAIDNTSLFNSHDIQI